MRRVSERELKSRTEGNLYSMFEWFSWGLRLRLRTLRCLPFFFFYSSCVGNRDFPPQRQQLWNYSCSFSKPHRESEWGPLKQLHKPTDGDENRIEREVSFSVFSSSAAAGEMEERRQKKRQNGSLWVHSTCLMDLDFFFLLLRSSIMVDCWFSRACGFECGWARGFFIHMDMRKEPRLK